MKAIDPDDKVSAKRFDALSAAVVPSTIRSSIVSNKTPLNLNEIVGEVESHLETTSKSDQQREVLDWLNIMTDTYPDNDGAPGDEPPPFLKVRCHLNAAWVMGLC